jgi:hypothetical protein
MHQLKTLLFLFLVVGLSNAGSLLGKHKKGPADKEEERDDIELEKVDILDLISKNETEKFIEVIERYDKEEIEIDLKAVNEKGQGVLALAVIKRNLDMIQLLIHDDVNATDTDSSGRSVWDYVFASNDPEIIRTFNLEVGIKNGTIDLGNETQLRQYDGEEYIGLHDDHGEYSLLSQEELGLTDEEYLEHLQEMEMIKKDAEHGDDHEDDGHEDDDHEDDDHEDDDHEDDDHEDDDHEEM